MWHITDVDDFEVICKRKKEKIKFSIFTEGIVQLLWWQTLYKHRNILKKK